MNKDKREHNSPFKDKRIILIYIIVIIALLAGVTYALQSSSLAFNLTTALIGLDEEKYGDLEFDSSNLEMVPILDSEVESRPNNVIKIDFKVGGAITNNASKPIIYDIALVNLDMHCALISNYLKWKLVKDGTELSSGSFSYTFDTIKEGRLVLTNTQEDLPDYSSTENGYHNYSFYIWISDSCQAEDISTCVNNTDAVNEVTEMMNKSFSGKIEVELYTGSKKSLVRTPGTEMDYDACRIDSFSTTISYKKNVQEYTVMYPGYYALTAVGAAGGGATAGAGGGGAASGTMYLEKGQKLYIVTGGVGTKTEGGYNGGGSGGTGKENVNQGYGGGGATHIATTDRGVLVNYQSNTSDLLLVAGGGGGVSGAGTGSKVGTGVSNDPLSGGNSEADGGYDIHASDNSYFSGNPGTGATTSNSGSGGAVVEAIRVNNSDGARKDNTTAYSGGGGGGGGGYYGGGGGAGGHVLHVEATSINNSGLNGSFGQGGNAGDGKSEELAYHPTAGGGGGGGSHYFSSKLTSTFYDNSTNVSAGYVVITYIPDGDYVVTFDTGDGTMTNPIKTITPGEEYSALPTAAREGFYFSGWYTESAGGIKVTALNNVEVSSNQILYARWTTGFSSQEFGYTGDVQTFTAPHTGTYKLEAWGAQGGTVTGAGGKGAYVSGELTLEEGRVIYIYVGQTPSSNKGGYNGGGLGGTGSDTGKYRGGGGATDFRLVGGTWNNSASLASRIMVAAGGAGGGYYESTGFKGGAGGALIGLQGTQTGSGTSHTLATGGTQTAGGFAINGSVNGQGHFGYADTEYVYGSGKRGTGGGGGYYGGGKSYETTNKVSGAAGGSSYVSGYTGCVAITSESNITPKSGCTDGTTDVTCSYHYSGYIFSNSQMRDGASSQPTIDGTTTQTGHASSGYAKITAVS